MSIDQEGLKNVRNLIEEIDLLLERKEAIKDMSDDNALRYFMDFDIDIVSVTNRERMSEVSEAFRLSLIQLIDEETERKVEIMNKIKVNKNEIDRDSQ